MFFGRRKKNDCGDIPPELQNALLFLAALAGSLTGVKVAIDCGADPNIQNKDGDTPLHDAARSGSPEVVKLLLEHGANPNIQDYKYDWTPLHYAVKGCHVDVARVLLDYGADPTIRDNEGRTPLDYGSDCEEIIEELRRRSGSTTVYK